MEDKRPNKRSTIQDWSNDSISVCVGDDEIGTGEDLTVLGWGRTSENGSASEALQEVTVPHVSLTECRSLYSGRQITEAMLCAGRIWTV